MKVEVIHLAREDLLEGFRFYEARETGLGSYFLDSLFSDIDSLRFFGGIHRKAHNNLHRSLSKRFPFAIYYTVHEELIQVRAVIDCRRNPSWIRRRLGGT